MKIPPGWKQAERQIAQILNGRRVGNTGKASEDVEHAWLSIEVKTRARLPGWIETAMRQAERNAASEKLPIVVAHRRGDNYDNALVVTRLRDFKQWFGD